MSRIGKQPVVVPSGVKVEISGRTIKVGGPKGALSWAAPAPIDIAMNEGRVVVNRPDDEPRNKALHGLSRALIANMVEGVSQGYTKALELHGTGYSVKVDGKNFLLNCGFMGRGVGKPAQFVIPIPAGLTVTVETPAARGNNEPAKFSISGADKQLVHRFAAEIRAVRKPEPYLGKGFRYAGERIRRKAGKVFAGGG